MAILIDGYNLMNEAGIVADRSGGHGFERSRRALLDFVISLVSPGEIAGTTVVFDSNDAPPGLPKEEAYQGVRVLYARDYDDADSWIEEIISADSAPRQLTVVSSDHRIQRAARRRRAIAVDSDQWVQQLIRHRADDRSAVDGADPAKPTRSSPTDTEYWLREFGDADQSRPPAEGLDDPFPPGFFDEQQ